MTPAAHVAVGAVRVYQWTVRPVIGANCRFFPSCSDYAIEALHAHGALRGSGLAARRILRCNPWNAGGYDPVPECDFARLSRGGRDEPQSRRSAHVMAGHVPAIPASTGGATGGRVKPGHDEADAAGRDDEQQFGRDDEPRSHGDRQHHCRAEA
jgi:putative membrane protein insertion efficiency factor